VTTKKLAAIALACLWSFANGAAAQQCSSLKGVWTDAPYGYVWTLNQSGSGQVYIAYCGTWPLWSVSGSLSSGDVTLTAYNPSWGDGACGNLYFQYSGTLARGGCNVASGTWFNDLGSSGSWSAGKSCEIPPYETTSSTGGGWSGAKYIFHANVANTSGGNLSGRKYRETNYASGYDACWYPTSPIPKFESVTQLNPFYLSSNNFYVDEIGWGHTSITHYRSHGDAPCKTHIYQGMKIACGIDGAETYTTVQNNVLLAEIGVTTISTTRDGVTKTRTYP
jgi:hypothetical protein